jgi:hypothetical protein
MLLLETAIFYFVLGTAVAVAVYLRGHDSSPIKIAMKSSAACLFWPLFVPLLLTSSPDESSEATKSPETDTHQDSLAAAISQVETELDTALGGLDGWAEDVLASEQHRLEELRAAWKAQAVRIRQIDQLLAEPAAHVDSLAQVAVDVESARKSERTRLDNIQQLVRLRNRMHADLVGTLAWVRELVTMIHLAKFSGAPAARAEELVAQIAAAVQGLSEVSSWREQDQEVQPVRQSA